MSQKSSGYERISGDRYFTPPWVIEALLSVEKFDGLVIDPAAGGGAVVAACAEHRITSAGFDIAGVEFDDLMFGSSPRDFYAWEGMGEFNHSVNFITNPPYGSRGRDAVSFIIHSLRHARRTRGKVAMLLRVDFDSAKSRKPVFGDHPAFKSKYPILKRIHWSNVPEKFDERGRLVQPSENHAWFVWDWSRDPKEARTYGYL